MSYAELNCIRLNEYNEYSKPKHIQTAINLFEIINSEIIKKPKFLKSD